MPPGARPANRERSCRAIGRFARRLRRVRHARFKFPASLRPSRGKSSASARLPPRLDRTTFPTRCSPSSKTGVLSPAFVGAARRIVLRDADCLCWRRRPSGSWHQSRRQVVPPSRRQRRRPYYRPATTTMGLSASGMSIDAESAARRIHSHGARVSVIARRGASSKALLACIITASAKRVFAMSVTSPRDVVRENGIE